MTVKQFFKSTTFKCIAALLAILLVCGVFLTIMYGFLEVTDEERFSRAIAKIYGSEVTTEQLDLTDAKTEFDYSTVIDAYKVTDDGNYLVKMIGKEGFAGTVTCWVVVEMSEDGRAIEGVMKIVIDTAPTESYIGNISQSNLDELAGKAKYGVELEGGFIHGSTTETGKDYVQTGASCSMRAISNAANGAMEFVAAYALGEVKADFYADNGFEYLAYITKSDTSYAVEGDTVTYTIVAAKGPAGAFTFEVSVDGGKVTAFEVKVDGGTKKGDIDYKGTYYDVANYIGKDLEYFKSAMNEAEDNIDKDIVDTGASVSSFLCVYAGAFATANYGKCLEIPYGGNE